MVEDECKIQREPNSFYRWSVKGETPVTRVDRKKGDAVSFYGGLSLKTKKVITYPTQENQNSHETCFFLDKIKKKYKGKGKVLLVWDGAKHHMGEVKDWLEKNPDIVELYKFPSYCPDLNPQEHVWKALRAYLSEIIHKVSYDELIKRATKFLKGHLFDYNFGVTADLI